MKSHINTVEINESSRLQERVLGLWNLLNARYAAVVLNKKRRMAKIVGR
jgi:hypothetical protein